MSRSSRPILETQLAQTLLGDLAHAEKFTLFLSFAEQHGCELVLRPVLTEFERAREALRTAEKALEQQQQIITKLTAKPHPVATFLGWTGEGNAARVLHFANERVVGLREGFDAQGLVPGDAVELAEAGNVILERCASGPRGGELAAFERCLPDGALLVRHRDEQVVLRPLGRLRDEPPTPGDQIRFDRATCCAFEIVPRDRRPLWLREDPPQVPREAVGGIDGCLERIFHVLTATLTSPDRAQRYGLQDHRTILLHGPPGVGKTLSARWAVSEVARLTGRRCRYLAIKPAEFDSKWVGQTEENIRSAFAELRESAREDGFVVGYFDEIEAIARIRGGAVSAHSDRALTALLAEMDGFVKLSNVALIFATNRKDLIDPAALERFSAVDIRVPRPNQRAATAIFRVHLPANLPFSPNGAEAAQTRDEQIDLAVSRLYSPNADNAVCRLRFRDGRDRVIAARELVSGRLIQQICRDACERAFRRDCETGSAGVEARDLEASVEAALERLRSQLSIRNAHAYLDDLPQDLDVVAVEALGRRISQPHRFFNP